MPSRDPKYIINEQILAEWIDTETASPCTLGSCSLFNRQTTDLFMKVGIEPETGHAQIYISLVIDARVGTKTRRKEMRLILLPHTFKDLELPLIFESLQISNLTNSSVLQQADLTNSGHIIRVRFNLASQGYVVIPKSKNPIKPTTSTSRDLIRGFKSLSAALNFTVYMRQSDYAKSGLQTFNRQLRDTAIGPSHVNLVGMFEGRDAMFMWVDLETDNRHQRSQEKQPPPYVGEFLTSPVRVQIPQSSPIIREQPPPLYTEGASTSSARVQVPQSPPNIREERPQLNTGTVLIQTPTRTSIHDSPIPPTASQTSNRSILDIGAELENIEEGLETDLGSDKDYYATLQARESSLDREAASYVNIGTESENVGEGLTKEIDSDEEYYATLHARESSLAREAASVSETLLLEVTAWLDGAMTINRNVYKHRRLTSRLLTLGYHARTQNSTALDATLIWCSTVLFYDPADSGIPELWSATTRWLISDVAELIRWSSTLCRSPEMCFPHIRGEFLKLGSAARAVALKLACDKNLAEYRRQRARCLGVVLLEFGRPGTSGEDEKRFMLQ